MNHRVANNGTPLDRRHSNLALEARKAGTIRPCSAIPTRRPIRASIIPMIRIVTPMRTCCPALAEGLLLREEKEDAAPLAVDFFRRCLRSLDAEPPLGNELSPDRLNAMIEELGHREAVLAAPDEDADGEHPALAYETVLLQQWRIRAPMFDGPSLLLREYLRRALAQLAAIEKARLLGDYSVAVTDPLFFRECAHMDRAKRANSQVKCPVNHRSAGERPLSR